MKKVQSLIINEKSSSMSQYLIIAHNKLSQQKEAHEWPEKNQKAYSLHKSNYSKALEKISNKNSITKAQRSMSDAILPNLNGLSKQSFLKLNKQSDNVNLRIPASNQLKKPRQSVQAEAIVFKWRKSISGIQLKKKSSVNKVPKYSLSQFKNPVKMQFDSRVDPKKSQPFNLTLNHNYLNRQSLSLSKQSSFSQQTTKKLYYSIKHYNKDQQFWLFHLDQELSLNQVIEQFQKIELNRNVQPTKKLTMRQAYQLKKQIVFEIQQEKSLSIHCNIERLAELALDQKEKDKFLMIGFFIELREKLKSHQFTNNSNQNQPMAETVTNSNHISQTTLHRMSFIYRKSIIDDIKNEIKTWKHYKFQDANIINIKILSILALHVMKLQSPLFSFQDLELISKTIKLKKKGQSIIDYMADQDKTIHFQSLIYLIFQFYKNLYYLKLDEEMKIQQYNSLKAYLDLYESRDAGNFLKFEEKYKIASVLQTIKPASVGIYPYQDSKVRNQIRFKTLQKELNNESSDDGQGTINKKPKIKINKKTLISHLNQEKQIKMLNESDSESLTDRKSKSDFSSQQDSSVLESKAEMNEAVSRQSFKSMSRRRSSISKNFPLINSKVQIKSQVNDSKFQKKLSTNLKLTLTTKNVNRESIEKNDKKVEKLMERQPQALINSNNFCFSFIVLKENQLLTGSFTIILSENNTVINMGIHITQPNSLPLLSFHFSNIRIFTQSFTFSNFQKFMWKVFKKIFVLDFISQQNPLLMKQYNEDPEHLQKYAGDKVLGSEFRLVQVIHDYLIYWIKRENFVFRFCGKTIETPKFASDEINNYMENLEYEHDRKLFQKRLGYLDSSSGRRTGFSPGKNIQLAFSEIRNEFTIKENKQTSDFIEAFNFQKNILLLVKIKLSDTTEMKLVRMLFFRHVREISIYEIGFLKHSSTSVIQEKIPTIRRIENRPQLYRNRLISKIQKILTKQNTSFTDPNFQSCNFMRAKSFRIEQQFQVDLTNDYKFIPTIEMELVYEYVLSDFEIQMIRNQRQEERKSQSLTRTKIEKNFIMTLQSVQSRQVKVKLRKYMNSSLQKKSNQVITTFKVRDKLFLTVQFEHEWGKRFLSISKNLQFFQNDIQDQAVNQVSFTYEFRHISLYNMAVMVQNQVNDLQFDGKVYYYQTIKKPFLSKVNTSVFRGENADENSNKSVNSNKGRATQDSLKKSKQIMSIVPQKHYELHYIEQKLYVIQKNHRMLKFFNKKVGKSQYYSLQMFQTIQKLEFDLQQTHKPLFIYQLTNLQNPQTKHFLRSESSINFNDLEKLQSCIDVENFTFRGQTMEQFEIPIHKAHFQNEYFEKKTKNVRKKVVSEANYYFEETVLQTCNNFRGQNILIDVLQKYRVSKREKFKFF